MRRTIKAPEIEPRAYYSSSKKVVNALDGVLETLTKEAKKIKKVSGDDVAAEFVRSNLLGMADYLTNLSR